MLGNIAYTYYFKKIGQLGQKDSIGIRYCLACSRFCFDYRHLIRSPFALPKVTSEHKIIRISCGLHWVVTQNYLFPKWDLFLIEIKTNYPPSIFIIKSNIGEFYYFEVCWFRLKPRTSVLTLLFFLFVRAVPVICMYFGKSASALGDINHTLHNHGGPCYLRQVKA